MGDPDDFPERVIAAVRRGEVEHHEDGTMTVCGHRFDRHGNPMVKVSGCPNCGEGAGWVDCIVAAASSNSGRDLNAPCSRRCALQLEHAASVAAARLTKLDDYEKENPK